MIALLTESDPVSMNRDRDETLHPVGNLYHGMATQLRIARAYRPQEPLQIFTNEMFNIFWEVLPYVLSKDVGHDDR